MGRDLERRPFKHYYARYAREAYPAMGMGRELLSLNLGFATLLAQPPETMPGEARQSFRALGALPPLRYRAPDAGDHAADPRCAPRGDIPHDQLLQMPLLHNPMLEATPAERRATPAEEREMLRWAKHGVTRVAHVLNAAHTRVLEFEELCAHRPNLVGRGATRACVKRMFETIRSNLRRWRCTLAAGSRPEVQQGHFRHTRTGQLLRARQTARAGDSTVPAWVCETEPQTGAIRVTDDNGTKSRVAGESMSNKTFHVANWHHNHRTGPPRPSGDREIVGRMERISKGVGWRGVQPEWCMRCSSASTCTALALTVRHASTRQERYASCTKLS